MDIRTKLVFALVALALGSMLALGAFMYASADRRLGASTMNQLEAVAESRQQAIEDVLAGWRERVQLIASRTQLRLSLRDYDRTRDPEDVVRIRRILSDAVASVRTVLSVTVFDPDGVMVTHVGLSADPRASEPAPAALQLRPAPQPPSPASGTEVAFAGVSFDADERPRVAFVSDLILERENVGQLLVLLDGHELVDLTRNVTGLGATGEVLIVMRDERGIHTLHPVRHPHDGHPGPVRFEDSEGAADPAARALDGVEDVFAEGLVDYRGQRVLAATRHIPETGWGLVVKVDDAEEQGSANEFRSEMVTLALSLSAFAILFAVILGFRFATPIHHLSEVANRIRGGELGARATVKREDEIGMLASSFNQMADTLEEQVAELRQFHRFFEVSLDMLCIAGTDGYFKRVNPAFERTLGWSREQLVSRPFFDLVHPDDLESTAHEIDRLAQGIPTISFVNRFRCVDGSYKRLRWTSYPEPDTGLLYAVAREIAEPTAAW